MVGVGFVAALSVPLYRNGWLVLLNCFPQHINGFGVAGPFPVSFASKAPVAEYCITKFVGVAQFMEDQGTEAILVHMRLDVRIEAIPCIHEF